MIYSPEETALVIKLRKEGLVGQRLYNRFHKVFPDRSWRSVRHKVEALQENSKYDLRKTRRIRYLRELEKGPKTARQLSDAIGVTPWSAIRIMSRIVDAGKATDTIERNAHMYTIVDNIIDERV